MLYHWARARARPLRARRDGGAAGVAVAVATRSGRATGGFGKQEVENDTPSHSLQEGKKGTTSTCFRWDWLCLFLLDFLFVSSESGHGWPYHGFMM